jgi:hypothetical protein
MPAAARAHSMRLCALIQLRGDVLLCGAGGALFLFFQLEFGNPEFPLESAQLLQVD